MEKTQSSRRSVPMLKQDFVQIQIAVGAVYDRAQSFGKISRGFLGIKTRRFRNIVRGHRPRLQLFGCASRTFMRNAQVVSLIRDIATVLQPFTSSRRPGNSTWDGRAYTRYSGEEVRLDPHAVAEMVERQHSRLTKEQLEYLKTIQLDPTRTPRTEGYRPYFQRYSSYFRFVLKLSTHTAALQSDSDLQRARRDKSQRSV